MSYSMIGPFRIPPEMRRDIDIMCRIRGISRNDYVTEAWALVLERDKQDYSVGYKAFAEAQRQIDEEVDRQRKAS